MKPKDLASYAFLALAWGLSFLVLLRVLNTFGLAGTISYRSLIAAVTLLLLSAVTRRRLRFGGRWLPFVVVGATTVAGQLIGLSYATPMIGTAMTAILVASIPLLSMVIGRIAGIERISPNGVVGLVLGVAGIVMLVGFPSQPVDSTFLLGCAAAMFGCVCAACGSLYASRSLKGTGSWEVTIGAFLSGGVMTLPLGLISPLPPQIMAVDIAYLLVLGCVMSAMTYVLYFRLVSTIGPTRAISVEFAVTVVAVLVGALHLGEQLSLMQVAGAAVIVSGCALVLGLVRIPARLLRW
ncbi:DMT family transporter [Novispirillum itersonii]|uniref:Drug/metabolite transporter (DMT)-like permease n=1 Tax=Novispirillum itersonii TaxID=189 RepID=A0A7W9ZDC3_NOVIT|nr:DMT family transporter [Novispirillum itersonii]MBB6209407.1 drug/metabolite transporter (DMT)-like permease [Novispirillum itersonii]